MDVHSAQLGGIRGVIEIPEVQVPANPAWLRWDRASFATSAVLSPTLAPDAEEGQKQKEFRLFQRHTVVQALVAQPALVENEVVA
jgi:hypothetical protein